MKKILAVIMIVLINLSANGQFIKDVSKVGTTAAPFLSIGIGSRSEAIGGAFVAISDDASALYWNPAGIARLKSTEVMAVHSKWLAEMDFNFVGLVIPLGIYGAIGGSFTSLSSGDMLVRTVEQPNGTGEYFSAIDMAMQLSFGYNLTDRFSVGLSVKYINQKIWKESASAFAIDIGTLFTTGFRGMRIGATLSNFGNDMQMTGNDLLVYHDIDEYKLGNNERIPAYLGTEKWPLPLNFQLGAAVEVLQNETNRMTLAVDAMHPSDNTESINLGLEYAFQEFIFLRGGLRNLFIRDGEEGFAVGAGLSKRFMGNFKVNVDFSLSDFGRLGYVQRFSFGLSF